MKEEREKICSTHSNKKKKILVLIDLFLIWEFNGGSVSRSSVFKVINGVLILEMSFYLDSYNIYKVFYRENKLKNEFLDSQTQTLIFQSAKVTKKDNIK